MTNIPYSGRAFGAFLFDMDGTILTSTAAAERAWGKWALGHGLDLATFLPTMHGRRATETIGALNLPGIDVQAEAHAVLLAEMDDVEGIEPIPGAAAFLASLPADRWALVTSAPRDLAKKRLAAAGLPLPPRIIAGEDVVEGKPSPEGFLRGARELGQKPEDCLVFEDAAAGIAAGEASGASVLVITAMHKHALEAPHPTIASYQGMSVSTDAHGRLIIEHHPSLTTVEA